MADPRRILIVDDDAVARSALVEILTMEGYAVETAGDGYAALEKLSAFAPETILCDLGMPGMDGVTFIKKAKLLAKPFRLAIMSASYAGPEVATTLGADYVSKPIDVDRLLYVLAREPKPVPVT
jgi:CheY-like chemotaxis protein